MELKVRVPYKLNDTSVDVPLYIEVLEDKNNRQYFLQLKNDPGIDSLNHWIKYQAYDNNIYKFPSYDDLMATLTELKEDVEIAWANYDEENKNMDTVFRKVKKLFQPIEWKEE